MLLFIKYYSQLINIISEIDRCHILIALNLNRRIDLSYELAVYRQKSRKRSTNNEQYDVNGDNALCG